MAGNIFWYSGAVISGFGAQLSGQGAQLTNAAAVQLSGDLYNTGASGGPAFFLAAQLMASASGYGAAIQSQKNVDLYLVPSLDGTNFPTVDVTNASLPTPSFKGSFVSTTSGNQKDVFVLEGIPILPLRYRGYIINNLGQTLTSGWGVTFNTYEEGYS